MGPKAQKRSELRLHLLTLIRNLPFQVPDRSLPPPFDLGGWVQPSVA